MELPDKTDKRIDQLIEDIEQLTHIHQLSNEVSAGLYSVFGMTPVTKTALEVFYKLRIFILEIGLREWDLLKNSSPDIMYNPDEITRFATYQEELDEAKRIWQHFLDTGELNEASD
jgi:hypothetical protein